jgi:DNA-directed RNA polymerase subunit RPC12/RpoP
MRNEFAEIAHAGGKIEFTLDEDKMVSTRISSSSPYPFSIIRICVSHDGVLLDFVPYIGIAPDPIHPQPSVCVNLISDREGMWGRHCPSCDSYFRTKQPGRLMACPYCGFKANNVVFTTAPQRRFLGHYLTTLFSLDNNQPSAVLDISSILQDLNSEAPDWLYTEERQQSTYKCANCGVTYDILGLYGSCCNCSKYNGQLVFDEIITSIKNQFEQVNSDVHDRTERALEWEKFVRCISEFEALGNDIVRRLLTFPMTNKRRNELNQLSFQRIGDAVKKIEDWYSIKIWEEFREDEAKFINLMFQRRHIFTHQAGRVDAEYMKNTGDSSVKIGQILRLRSNEIKRLLPLLQKMGMNLIAGFEEMWIPENKNRKRVCQ